MCVKKQSLKDKSCLVACSGLYADMDYYDNNLKQTMQTFEQRVAKGEMFKSILLVPFIIISGINLLNHNLRYGGVRWYSNTKENQKDLYVAIQEMFPLIADQKNAEVEALTMKYHQYKRNYVKHISFNPTTENLSK